MGLSVVEVKFDKICCYKGVLPAHMPWYTGLVGYHHNYLTALFASRLYDIKHACMHAGML